MDKISTYENNPKRKAARLSFNKKYYNRSIKDSFNKSKRYTQQELLLIWQHNISDKELAAQLGRGLRQMQITRHRIKTGQIHVDFKI